MTGRLIGIYMLSRLPFGRLYRWPLGRIRRRRRQIEPGNAAALAGALGAGAGLMYLFDPDRGRRRRATLKDAMAHAANKTGNAIGATSRDLFNRAKGLTAKATSIFRSNEAIDDVIEARVRSKLGRLVSHPGSIDAAVSQGRVTLTGSILEREVDDLISRVLQVHGVKEVVNQLSVHKQAGDVPELQGGSSRTGDRFELLQSNWSPAARVLTAMAGGALVAEALRRRGGWGAGLGLFGFGLMLRGITNIETKRLFGFGGGRRAVDVQKTINIDAPVERVFEFWTNYANFPHFMHNVREVRDLGRGRSHWIVAGPAGLPVEWNAVITEFQPARVIAWKSEPGSVVANAGIIRFDPNESGGTRVNIRLSYNPPGGAMGHAVARVFGADPKHEMDEDLLRLKTMIETGHPPHDAPQPTPEAAMAAR